ncbi:MAG TPA: hypothetical protein VFS20_09310 [Longimicrobium sp.]|nr:hypothetical protein [Longimicrobium sp.]
MKRNFVLAAALALAAAHPAAAQLRIPPVQLIAGVGRVSGSHYATFSSAEETHYMTHGRATALQLGLQTTSPVRGVDLRLNLQRWRPQMHVTVPSAAASGGNVPHEIIYPTQLTSLTLDGIVKLPRVLEARPYVVAGAGLTRFDFNQNVYVDADQPVVPADATRPTAHLGLGTAWNVGSYDLFVEGSAYMVRLGDPVTSQQLRLNEGHNFTLTAGIRIPLKR